MIRLRTAIPAVLSLKVVLVMLLAAAAWAQDVSTAAQDLQPHVTAELTPDVALVGQPLVLRIKILVPTWLPTPPAFPAVDAPNLIVRLPEGASGPISERIDGETWSGVSRAYRLYPMIPGEVVLPAQSITVEFADPETTEPVTYVAELDPVRFTATVPEAAAGLDPLILAESVTLEQTLEAPDGSMLQGDSATRIVTAKVTGTSPLFIPELFPVLDGNSVRAYPKDPVIEENEDRGALSGSRTESVSYIAQYGGSVELPPVVIDWFNVDSGEVETVQLEGATLDVDAPGPPAESRFSTRQIATLVGALVIALFAFLVFRKYALPPLVRLFDRAKAKWEASETFAARRVRQAISNQDLAATHSALAIWSDRCPGTAGSNLQAALAGIGARTYGVTGESTDGWAVVSSTFRDERDRRRAANGANRSALPPLNP